MTDRPTGWLTDWLTDWLIDWLLIDWLTDWLNDWLTGWLTDLVSKKVKVKLKCSRYRPGVAQKVGRGIALLFLDHDTRRGEWSAARPRLHFTPGKDPVPIVREAGWAPGPVWTGGKSLPQRDSIPDRPARSQSLYRLSYRAHDLVTND